MFGFDCRRSSFGLLPAHAWSRHSTRKQMAAVGIQLVGIGWLAFPAMGVSQNTALAPKYRSFLCKKDRINVL